MAGVRAEEAKMRCNATLFRSAAWIAPAVPRPANTWCRNPSSCSGMSSGADT